MSTQGVGSASHIPEDQKRKTVPERSVPVKSGSPDGGAPKNETKRQDASTSGSPIRNIFDEVQSGSPDGGAPKDETKRQDASTSGSPIRNIFEEAKNGESRTPSKQISLFSKNENSTGFAFSAEERQQNLLSFGELGKMKSFCEAKDGELEFKSFKSVFKGVPLEFAKRAKWRGNTFNNIIDYFQQGAEGNCGLLSAIQAIGQLPDGGKGILKRTITPVDGGFKVSFLGKRSGPGSKDQPVFISYNDIANDSLKRRNKNSDLETSILNQAAHKAVGAPPYNPGTMLTLLTGVRSHEIRLSDYSKLSDIQKKSCVAWYGNHAWGLENYDPRTGITYLRNPHLTARVEKRSDTPYRLYTIGDATSQWLT